MWARTQQTERYGKCSLLPTSNPVGLLGRRSLHTKAPLAAATVILLVVGTLATTSLLALRRTLHDNAGARLITLNEQLGGNFTSSTAASRQRYLAMAGRPAIAAYLQDPGEGARDAAVAALEPSGPQSELTLKVELRRRDGRIELMRENGSEASTLLGSGYDHDWPALADAAASSDPRVHIGKLRQSGEIIFWPAVAMVPKHADAFVVTWRRIGNNAQARADIARTLGSEAAIYLGNADETVWSELGVPSSAPPPSTPGQVFQFARAGRDRMIAVRGVIGGTPWAYSLEFPTAVVEAPARRFVWTMSQIAAGCVLAGALLAWVVSRRVTAPLLTLATAADRIARGEPARVDLKRQDELGRLGIAFNAMAAEVEAARRHLEEAVEKRTGELRAAQESLARREKLALIGHLASGVGHEIRNPLGVMANAVFYLETIQPDASPEVRQYLGILRRQIELSAKIVNDLLELSRTSPANRERIGIDRLVDERLQRVGTSAAVEADIPPDLPPVVVDPVHAGQVLDNLFTNALQAIDGAPGKVRVKARATDDGFVRVEVSDTGPGIPREHFGKVFEPLFTTKARGIGLGLALSKSLAQANGGDLALVSGPDQSATFAFTLPAADGFA